MKSLFKIVKRYIGAAFFITFLILILNIFLDAYFILYYGEASQNLPGIENVSKEITKTGDEFEVTEKGKEMLESYEWAFLLDEDGTILWSDKLPEDLNKSYSLTEVAGFSRWYLKDYPVKVWTHPDGLLVLASEKNSVWKQQLVLDMNTVNESNRILLVFLLGNTLLILLLCLLFGYRFYRSLKPVALGIETLAEEKSIRLPEKGMTAELAGKLNQTSELLEKQKKLIETRDTARTNWIAGVSHDIRTPLSMIMGYSEQLEQAKNLDEEQKKQVQIMKAQSIKIKRLIEDLNLTSKLQYQMQPLRSENYHPAKQFRQIVASYYNEGLSEQYEINLEIAPEIEPLELKGDLQLLNRAYENLIGNSIRHNEAGCKINITLQKKEEMLELLFCDDGVGIPAAVKAGVFEEDSMQKASEEQELGNVHIMGLHVVKQIILSHGGSMEILTVEKGATIRICLPVMWHSEVSA